MSTKYERSETYRTEFIRAWPPVHCMYQCVYCGKRIRKDDMQVDHIIPVRAVRHNLLYRLCVPKEGVNSLQNLVPSCPRCNRRKGGKTGLWSIRGRYWKICLPVYRVLRVVYVLCIVFVILFALGLMGIEPFTALPYLVTQGIIGAAQNVVS